MRCLLCLNEIAKLPNIFFYIYIFFGYQKFYLCISVFGPEVKCTQMKNERVLICCRLKKGRGVYTRKKTTLLWYIWYILYIIEVNRMVEKCKIGKMNCNRHLRVAYETVCIMRKIINYTVKFFQIFFFIPKKN